MPIVGKDGTTLYKVFDPIPEAYLSICAPKMPNYFMYLGPNGGPGTGSNVHYLENVCEYMIKCIQKLQQEYIKSMTIS